MGNFLEIYRHKYRVDEEKALEIYKQAMNYELLNFETAI